MIKGYQSKILTMYDKMREKNQKELASRKKEIENVIPRVSEIEKEIAKRFIDISMSSFKKIDNRDEYIRYQREKITDLRVERSELLVSKGYPLDYLEEKFECHTCKDTGFILNKRCSCFQKKLTTVYYENSSLKDLLLNSNFSNFNLECFSTNKVGNLDSPRKNMELILSRSQAYISAFDSSNESLLFYGNAGTGKTFLSHCIAKELLDRNFLVIYKTADELMDALKEIKFEKNSLLEDMLINCDLLIIDDLGTENDSDFSRTELYNLLNKKIMKNKRMIISTNFTIEQLMKRYSERITSRLLGNFTLYKFYGDDIRIKLNLKKIR